MAIFGLVFFIGLVMVIYWAGRSILGPIDRAAQQQRAPGRISMGDFLCLFIAVQLPLAFVSRLRSEDTVEYFWAFTILAWLIAPIIWITCALTLSRAGISSGKHRLMFMGLVLPTVYYGLIPFVVMTTYGIVIVITGEGATIVKHSWFVALWAAVGAALIGCRLYTNWLVRRFGTHSALANNALEELPA